MVCMVIVMIIIQQFIAAPIANFQALESLYQDQDVSSILSAISIPSTSIFFGILALLYTLKDDLQDLLGKLFAFLLRKKDQEIENLIFTNFRIIHEDYRLEDMPEQIEDYYYDTISSTKVIYNNNMDPVFLLNLIYLVGTFIGLTVLWGYSFVQFVEMSFNISAFGTGIGVYLYYLLITFVVFFVIIFVYIFLLLIIDQISFMGKYDIKLLPGTPDRSPYIFHFSEKNVDLPKIFSIIQESKKQPR